MPSPSKWDSRHQPPATALTLVVLVAALLLRLAGTAHRAMTALLVIPLLSAAISLFNRLYGAGTLGVLDRYSEMSALASVATLAIALGVLASLPNGGPLGVVRSRGMDC